MNDTKNDPQVWPEDLSNNPLPNGNGVTGNGATGSASTGNGASESVEMPPRPVPRAGMGHADAWREHEKAGGQTFEEPIEPTNGDTFNSDALSGDALSGDALSGDALSGDALSGEAATDETLNGDMPYADLSRNDLTTEETHRDDSFQEDTPGYVEWYDDEGSSVPPTPPTTHNTETTETPVEVPPLVLPEDDLPDPATVPELAPLAATGSDGGGPPTQYSSVDDSEDEPEPEPERDPNAPSGAEESLWSHLGELRARILYSIAAVFVASCLTWNYGTQISEWFARPIRSTLQQHGVAFKLVTLDPTEGFLVYFQITLVSAILISMPFILFQMWRFLEPALTRTERRFSLVLLPFSVTLFFAGCTLGYAVSPIFFKFFLMFQPPGTDATYSYSTSIVLLAKMLLVFGLCFQVPVITIFLNKIGLVSRNFLIDYWRHAFVVIFIIVAILTPTWDPLTLIVCAGPPCLLYGLSIWMVKWL